MLRNAKAGTIWQISKMKIQTTLNTGKIYYILGGIILYIRLSIGYYEGFV